VTFVLKGHLKNARIGYIRAASLLARVREEKLWKALGHATIEEYAERRLGLGRTSLYRYLQVHDWLRDYDPAWLTRRPKGFIPEISDIGTLVWIDKQLRNAHLAEPLRKELEAMRTKAMAGKLSEREFREFKNRVARRKNPLRVLLGRLRGIRRFATSLSHHPPAAIAGIEAAIRATEASLANRRKDHLHRPRPQVEASGDGEAMKRFEGLVAIGTAQHSHP
jgi:hypothetical protein